LHAFRPRQIWHREAGLQSGFKRFQLPE
jgi:hypothetical protein